MSLNPSCNNIDGTRLPVIGDPPFPPAVAEKAKSELLGFLPEADVQLTTVKKEVSRSLQSATGVYVPSAQGEDDIFIEEAADVTAEVFGWNFRRAWYYWVARTDTHPIPEAEAKEFNATWGGQVRVDGYSGGYDVKGAVRLYHIDTVEGMIAFAALLRRLFRRTRTTMPRFTLMMPVVAYEGEGERTSFQMNFAIEAPTKHDAVDAFARSILSLVATFHMECTVKAKFSTVAEDNPVASLKAVADAMGSGLTDKEREILRRRLPEGMSMGWMFTKPADKEGGK